MIAATLLLLLQTAPAEDEIVVIGRRLAQISAHVVRDPRGRYHCALTGETGNAKLDASLCKAATKCVQKGAVSQSQVSACLETRKPALLVELRRSLGRKP